MKIEMQRRLLYIPIFHIDANRINARQKLESVNQLEQWRDSGVILINMSGIAYEEARAGGNLTRSRKTSQQIFTLGEPAGHEAPNLFDRMAVALFPGVQLDAGQRNDVCIACDAVKWSAILVTADGGSKTQPGGLLGNRDKVRAISGLRIMTSDEAVAFVREKISQRDEHNRRVASEFGGSLPAWTGTD